MVRRSLVGSAYPSATTCQSHEWQEEHREEVNEDKQKEEKMSVSDKRREDEVWLWKEGFQCSREKKRTNKIKRNK